MASQRKLIFSVLLATSALFLLAGKCSGIERRMSLGMTKLCADSNFPKLCEEITRGAADPKEATRMAIQALSLRAAHAKALAEKLRSSASGILKSSLDACVDVYDDAVYNLQKSLDNINSGDRGSLMSNLSAALTDLTTCDDSIQEASGDPTTILGKSNKVLNKLGNSCLDLADEIHF